MSRAPTPNEFASSGDRLPDLLGPALRLLFVGINPGLTAAAMQIPFSGRGNRFYAALHLAGITDQAFGTSAGVDPAAVTHLLARGIGITSLVARATARADELAPAELVAGAASLSRLVAQVRPRVVAILGITAYRVAFEQRSACPGRQPQGLAGAELWVVPNPSGRNAHSSPARLAAAYRDVALAAGLAVVGCHPGRQRRATSNPS